MCETNFVVSLICFNTYRLYCYEWYKQIFMLIIDSKKEKEERKKHINQGINRKSFKNLVREAHAYISSSFLVGFQYFRCFFFC